ncbi:MAG: hypothetical protein OER97_10125 [Gammaproteobacteria bacterium]|nr:hypothetical protein [Gammaproteobacteria bacterium]
MPALFVIAAIVLVVAIYTIVGRPDVRETSHSPTSGSMPDSGNMQSSAASSDSKADSVGSLVGGLEERLLLDPSNGKDWLLLAKSYDHLGRSADAVDAYQKAANLGVTESVLEQKLSAPNYQSSGDLPAQIRGNVSLSADAMSIVQATDTVFVIAREVGASPMPLAVVRRAAGELPIDFVLSDKDSMVGGRGISSAEKVIVEAKVSESGDALSTKAGLVARSEEFKPNDAPQILLVLTPQQALGAD